MKKTDTHKLTVLGMFCAIAFVLSVVAHYIAIPFIPAVPFLKYDPKDIVIVIASFLMGPISAVMISVVVSFIEFITISNTGIYGLIMNILASCAYACTAGLVYRRWRKMSGAMVGLVLGSVMTAGVMVLWNYIITPLYMNIPRNDLVPLLVPAFLPFNLIKAGINTAFALYLYKPVVNGLRKLHLVEEHDVNNPITQKSRMGLWLFASFLLATCVLLVLIFQGII